MRKIGTAFCLLMLAVPFTAQNYQRVQLGFGYSKLQLPAGFVTTPRHGFDLQLGFNLNRWFGIDNHITAYEPRGSSGFVAGLSGGKVRVPNVFGGRVVPYGVAGVGVGQVRESRYYGSGPMMTARWGGGGEFPINNSLGVRVELTRTSIHSGQWFSGPNATIGAYYRVK